MIKVKVCGITNLEDAKKAVYYGAYALGFVFYKKSSRYVSPSKVRKIVENLPPFITPVGVFVNLSEKAVRDICLFTGIRTLQFHGDEKPDYCKRFKNYKIIKTFRVGSFFDVSLCFRYKVDAFLFDAYQKDQQGGTGKTFNWNAIKGLKFNRPVILSGGINSQNVLEAIKEVSPYAVDLSSSLESSPGIKDPKLIKEFFDSLKQVQN